MVTTKLEPYQLCVVAKSDKADLEPIIAKLVAYDFEFRFKVYRPATAMAITVYCDSPAQFDSIRQQLRRELPMHIAQLV